MRAFTGVSDRLGREWSVAAGSKRPSADSQDQSREGLTLLTLKIIALVLIIFLGIPSQIIDYKHRKRKAYEHGNAWAYYTQLSKEGSWEGRFMMWSSYLVIYFVLGTLGYTFYALTR